MSIQYGGIFLKSLIKIATVLLLILMYCTGLQASQDEELIIVVTGNIKGRLTSDPG